MIMDKKWVQTLERLAALNAEKEKARLRSLTLEESGKIFEELCRLFHGEFDKKYSRPPSKKGHPVGLIKYWRKS